MSLPRPKAIANLNRRPASGIKEADRKLCGLAQKLRHCTPETSDLPLFSQANPPRLLALTQHPSRTLNKTIPTRSTNAAPWAGPEGQAPSLKRVAEPDVSGYNYSYVGGGNDRPGGTFTLEPTEGDMR
jgi:hypothetical protein